MKKETLFTFYADDNIVEQLKEGLKILPNQGEVGNSEIATSTLEDQLKNAKWSEVGIGRHTIVFYMSTSKREDDGFNLSIEKAHIISRHNTKTEIAEKASLDVKNALTTLNDSGTI